MSERYQRAHAKLETAALIRAHIQRQGESCTMWESMTLLANDLESEAWNELGCSPFTQIKASQSPHE